MCVYLGALGEARGVGRPCCGGRGGNKELKAERIAEHRWCEEDRSLMRQGDYMGRETGCGVKHELGDASLHTEGVLKIHVEGSYFISLLRIIIIGFGCRHPTRGVKATPRNPGFLPRHWKIKGKKGFLNNLLKPRCTLRILLLNMTYAWFYQ